MNRIIITLSLCIALAGCGAHRVNVPPGQTAPAITTLEQVNFDNAQFSIHLRAVGKFIRAAHDAGFVEKEYFDTLTAGEAKIIRLHQQLTPLLKGWPASGPNADTQVKIKNILEEVRAVATAMVSTGVVGVKNPTSQTYLTQDINAIVQLATEIMGLVQSLKPPPTALLFPSVCHDNCIMKPEAYHGAY